MPTSLNSLLIAWAMTVISVTGLVLWVEFTGPDPDPPQGFADAGDQQNQDPGAATDPAESEETAVPKNSDTSPAEEAATASDSVTVLPPPPAPSSDQSASVPESGARYNRPAPGEVVDPAEPPQTSAQSSTIPAPHPDLLSESRNGPLPRISTTGVRPADYYVAPKIADTERPRIALLVTDMGAIARRTERAMDGLPERVGIGFSPYSADLPRWTEVARERGFEYYLMIPMEPVDAQKNDPGPLGLVTRYSDKQNINLLHATLGQTTGYAGVVTHMGSRFSADSESLRPILLDIRQRGLIFIDSRATPYTRAGTMAQALGILVLQNDRFVDNSLSDDTIMEQLRQLENKARTLGGAMGLARPYPVSVRAIKQWADGLEDRGFDLVPPSSLLGYQSIR